MASSQPTVASSLCSPHQAHVAVASNASRFGTVLDQVATRLRAVVPESDDWLATLVELEAQVASSIRCWDLLTDRLGPQPCPKPSRSLHRRAGYLLLYKYSHCILRLLDTVNGALPDISADVDGSTPRALATVPSMMDEKDLIGFRAPRITTGWSFKVGDDGVISCKGNDVYSAKKNTRRVFQDSKPLPTVEALEEALREEGIIP